MTMTSTGKTIEIRGKNVETAIEQGLAELGLRRDEVEVEVLNPGSRGVLGIGSEDALVRLTRRPRPLAPEKAAAEHIRAAAPKTVAVARKEKPTPITAPEPKAPPTPPETAAEEVSSESEEEGAPLAHELLSDLLKHLGVDADVQARYAEAAEGEEPPLLLDVVGKDLGILIGRRGDTLAALQFLTRLMFNRHTRRWVNLVVDVEGYKARRERTLRELSLRMAERAVATGRVVALEAMPASERRIVHMALRDYPDVTTQSVGEGESRKVTIIPR